MILGTVVQSVFSYHVCSVVDFFSWHVYNMYLLNNQAVFGLLQLNVAIDKASSYHFQVTVVFMLICTVFLRIIN